MPFPNIDPVLIAIGPLAIRWYALAYITGILLGWFYARMLVNRHVLWASPPGQAPLDRAALDDFLLWMTLGIILGGRLGYVLFYNADIYLQNPLEALKLWQGGMSFHGGFLGSILAIVLFARAKQIPLWSLLDICAAATPIGLFFGRIANFINAELWGRTTDLPWGVVFPGGGPLPRHPSQLYEALLEGLLLFVVLAVLIFTAKALRRPGLVAGLFTAGYGASRFMVEFVREPDAHIGYLVGSAPFGLTMGMLLSLPMVALGLWGVAGSKSRQVRLNR